MGAVRPYVIDENDAIDLNLVTRVYIYEETKLALIMYYSEPVILEFSTKAQAKMKFNEIMKVWANDDSSLSQTDETELPCDNANAESSIEQKIQKSYNYLGEIKMGNKIEETMREFSECYDRLIKNVKVEDDSYYSTHIRLRSTVLKEFDAEKYNCTLQLKDEQRLDKGYYQQTWKICNGYDLKTFTLFINLNDHYVCLETEPSSQIQTWSEIDAFEATLKDVLRAQKENRKPHFSIEDLVLHAVATFNKHRELSEVTIQDFSAPNEHRDSLFITFSLRLHKQTWNDAERFVIYINPVTFSTTLCTNQVGPANEPEEEHSTPEPAKEPKEEQSKVPEFAQLCITNYERLQKLSILEIAKEFISIIRIKDEDGLTRRKYVVLNGDVCNSLSDAIKKNLEWLNDESI